MGAESIEGRKTARFAVPGEVWHDATRPNFFSELELFVGEDPLKCASRIPLLGGGFGYVSLFSR